MALTVNQDFITKNGVIVLGTNSVSSSTGQTGALQAEGGAAVAKNLIVGGTATLGSDTHIYATLQVDGAGTFSNTLSVASTTTLQDLTVNGGLNVAGGIQLTGALDFYGTATFHNQLIVTGTNATILGGSLEVGGKVLIDSTATATTAPDGALVIAGGEYIGGNLIVNGTGASLGIISDNALYVVNGVGIGDSLTVSGRALFKNAVTFQGTATYVYSTNTYYTDNIIEVHVPKTGANSSWTFDDGKDIGIRFNYFNTTDTNAALVLANDTKFLEFYSAGAEGANTFAGATYGTAKFGKLQLVTGTLGDGTTSTGDLTVTGAVGIGDTLVVAQTSTFLSNIAVSGNASAGSLTGQNFTLTNVVTFADSTGTIQTTTVGWNSNSELLTGTITYSNTATNLDSGDANYIPYQTAPGQTTFLPPGNEGTILSIIRGALTWASASGSTVGFASTATNLKDGTTGSIPYQSAPGVTAFDGTYFNYSGAGTTASLVTVYNLSATSTAVSSTIPVNNSIYNAGGLYSAKTIWTAADLFVGSSSAANFTGAGALHVTGGGYFGNNIYVANTGTGALTVVGGASFGKYITIQDSTNATSGGAGALVLSNGGAYINQDIYAGGNLTASNASITNNLTASSVTATNAVISNTLNIGPTYYSAGGYPSAFYINQYGIYNEAASNNQLFQLVTNVNTVTGGILSGASVGGGGLWTAGGGMQVYSAADLTFTMGRSLHQGSYPTGGTNPTGQNITFSNTGSVYIGNQTPTTGAGTGALKVNGGTSINGNLYVNNTATIGGDLYVDGTIYIQGVGLDTISSTTGTFRDVNVTGTVAALNLTVTGPSNITTITGTTGTFTNLNVTSTITGNNARFTGTLNVTGATTLGNIAGATATFTNLTVTGVTSIGGISLSNATADNLTVTNTLVVGNLITATNAVFTGTVIVGGQTTISGQTTINNTATINGPLLVTNTLDSNAKNVGSIVTYGGVGVGKSIVAGGAITVGTTLSGAGNVVPAVYSNNVLLASYTSNTITGSGTVNLDTYSTDYRTARYTIQVVDGTNVHITELTVFHDGTNVYLDEYGISTNHGELGVFSATLVGTTITLTFKPTSATSMTIKVVRFSILA